MNKRGVSDLAGRTIAFVYSPTPERRVLCHEPRSRASLLLTQDPVVVIGIAVLVRPPNPVRGQQIAPRVRSSQPPLVLA